MIVRDGEGVSRFVTVRVNGARRSQDADAAARAVANSALVKTSWHGGDPNWGRIIDALGYSAAEGRRRESGHRLQRARQPQSSLVAANAASPRALRSRLSAIAARQGIRSAHQPEPRQRRPR